MTEMEDTTTNAEESASLRKAGTNDYRSIVQDQNMAASLMAHNDLESLQDAFSQYSHKQRYQIPYDNTDRFVGRNDYLSLIDAALDPKGPPGQHSYRIWGLGGVGKTQIALAYANRSIASFDVILWVRAETEASLKRSFTDIAVNLELAGASQNTSPDDNRDLTLSWLLACKRRWLLVFDNVDSIDAIKDYWPSSDGSVLLTTRIPQVAISARGKPTDCLQIKPFDFNSSLTMFNKLIGEDKNGSGRGSPRPEDTEATENLLKQLGGLPLGIRQAAALIKTRNWMVADYLERYNEEAGNLEKMTGGSHMNFTFDQDYGFALHNVWKVSFDLLKQSGAKDAYSLLGILALLFPDSIPVDLFGNHHVSTSFIEFCYPENEDRFHDAKSRLAELALIDEQDSTLSIHRLVQNEFLHYMEPVELQDVCNAAARLLNHVFPKQSLGRPLIPEWAQCSKYAQHGMSLAQAYNSLRTAHSESTDSEIVELLSNCAWYLHEIGDWEDCNKVIEVAKARCSDKTALPYSHLLNTAGASLFELNKLAATRVNLEESYRIRKLHLAPDDEDLLCTTNNLANLESAEGRTDKALELFTQVRAAREKLGAGSEVSLALTYAGIARAYLVNQSFDSAGEYYDKALAIIVAQYGPRGHYVAGFHKELGCVALARGDLGEAERKFQVALELNLSNAPGHILTACLYYKLGVVMLRSGRRQLALDNLDEAMLIAKRRKSEGDIARISYHRSLALRASEDPKEVHEATSALTIARSLKGKLEREQASQHRNDDLESVECAYDRLVCHFFR